MKKVISLICITLSLLSANNMLAQDDKKVDPFLADQKFMSGNYEAALDDYLSLQWEVRCSLILQKPHPLL